MISNDELTELFLDLATVEVFLCKWDENQMPTDILQMKKWIKES